jgi:hypothetical protein
MAPCCPRARRERDRWFESGSLHQRVRCEPGFLDHGPRLDRFDQKLPSREPPGEVPNTPSVCSIGDHDLGVVAITKIAMKKTDAVLPAYPRARASLWRTRGPRADPDTSSRFNLAATFSAMQLGQRILCPRRRVPKRVKQNSNAIAPEAKA